MYSLECGQFIRGGRSWRTSGQCTYFGFSDNPSSEAGLSICSSLPLMGSGSVARALVGGFSFPEGICWRNVARGRRRGIYCSSFVALSPQAEAFRQGL